jgi:hypothetical protein
MGAASALGVSAPHLYRDNLLVRSGWYGNDLVTLLIAVPALVAAGAFARRRSAAATLVWLGLLDYSLYTYAFYLFGAAFNSLFLLYVAIVTLSIAALACGLMSLDVPVFDAAARRPRVLPVRAWLWFIAIGLGGVHVVVSLHAAVTGTVPAIVRSTGHPTNVVAALDLSMVVPVSIVAAMLLARGSGWGFVIAGISLVKGAVYMLALTLATSMARRAGALADASEVWLWGGLGVGCAIALVALVSGDAAVHRAAAGRPAHP